MSGAKPEERLQWVLATLNERGASLKETNPGEKPINLGEAEQVTVLGPLKGKRGFGLLVSLTSSPGVVRRNLRTILVREWDTPDSFILTVKSEQGQFTLEALFDGYDEEELQRVKDWRQYTQQQGEEFWKDDAERIAERRRCVKEQ